MTGNMANFIRPFVVFDNTCYSLESTMVLCRSWIDMEALPQERYESIMGCLLQLRCGYVYEGDDMIENPEGGIMTLSLFFREYGVVAPGGRLLSFTEIEESIEEMEDEWLGRRVVLDQRGPVLAVALHVLDDLEGLTIDLESGESFLDALDEVHVMNDVIGVWEDGSLDGTE